MPKTISTHYGRYTHEFKRLAVLLTYHPDILAVDVAHQLNIHPVLLYRWRQEMKEGKLTGKPSLDSLQMEADLLLANEKIKTLEAELKETQRERDFLKKAKRFFQAKNATSSRS